MHFWVIADRLLNELTRKFHCIFQQRSLCHSQISHKERKEFIIWIKVSRNLTMEYDEETQNFHHHNCRCSQVEIAERPYRHFAIFAIICNKQTKIATAKIFKSQANFF